MKELITTMSVVFILTVTMNAQVAINTDNSAPDNSALLDVKSNTKGMLLPRMTQAQRDAIINPATGLMIFQTDNTPGVYFNSGSTGSPAWVMAGGGGSGWSLTGNSGTSAAINFIGTTDNIPLSFRVNNQPAGKIDFTLFNTSLGYKALFSNTTGHSNVAYGVSALYQNTTRSNLVAIGDSALFNNGLGALSAWEAKDNTAVGSKALYANTSGYFNTASGSRALLLNTSGSYNTANGYFALSSNTTGDKNTANGNNALKSNTTGSLNTANGMEALAGNTTGNSNTANGIYAMPYNTTGNSNVAIGTSALYYNSTRSNSVAIGDSALFYNGLGATESYEAYRNTAIGSKALYANTKGSWNTANGFQALYSNTTGNNNTASGFYALNLNTTGSYNTSIGTSSLDINTTGSYNTAVGVEALHANRANSRSTAFGYHALFYTDNRSSSGRETYNTAIGYNALSGNWPAADNIGQYNTAVGDQAMTTNTSGQSNTAIGSNAMINNTTGSACTAVGTNALSTNIAGNNLACFGYNANVSSTSVTDDANALGFNAIVNANGKTRIGDVWQNTIEGNVGWSYPSDGRFKTNVTEDVKGLDFILNLRPVTYNFESRKFQEFLVKNFPDSVKQRYLSYNDHPDINPIRQSGFVAQEVVEAASKVGYNFDGVHAPADDNDNYSIVYSQFVVPLVKAVQEQQAMIEQLRNENALLKKHLEEIDAKLDKRVKREE
jgi:trimeric autotransporter adhesin